MKKLLTRDASVEWANLVRLACLSTAKLTAGISLTPVSETGFSHTLTAYKIVGHFFGLSYWKISGNNQVKNSFF